MSRSSKKLHTPCIGCGTCSPDGAGASASGGLRGWALVLSAAAVFLLPLALAAAGAALCGADAIRQTLGAAVGLGAGVLGGVVITRRLRRSAREAA